MFMVSGTYLSVHQRFLTNTQSLVLLAIVVIDLSLGFKCESSKPTGFLATVLIAVGLVFNAFSVKDVLLNLFSRIVGAWGGITTGRIRVCIANPGKYNEGGLVGVRFTPSVDFDEVKERVGLNDEYEEYAVHDYELPFGIDEYTPIEEINRLCGLAEELKGTPIGEVTLKAQHAFFSSFEEMVEHVDGVIYYPDRSDTSNVAYCLIVGAGDSGGVSEHLKTHIDFDACGRDLEINENYLVMSRGVLGLM